MPVVNFLQTQSKDTVRTTKIRNGAIEIFRFFLIFTVIWKHAIDSSPDPILFPIGVVGFFFLSGFFQVNSWKTRFWKFLITTVIYTIFGFIVYLILFYTKVNDFNPWNIFTNGNFLKDNFDSWYFLYIMLFVNLLAPYINKWIRQTGRWTALAITICIWLCVLFIVRFEGSLFGWDTFYYVNPIWIFKGCFVYMLGGVISFHFSEMFSKNKKLLVPLACAIICIYFLMNIFDQEIKTFVANQNLSWSLIDARSDFSLVALLFVISIVLCLNSVKISNGKVLKITSLIGKITLPMYLLSGVVLELINSFGYFNFATNDAYYVFLICFACSILISLPIGIFFDWLTNKTYFWCLRKIANKNI